VHQQALCTSSLVHQQSGAPAVLRISSLAHQQSSAPADLCTSSLAHQQSSAPAALCTSSLVHQQSGAQAVWCTSSLVHKQSGAPAALCTSSLVHQQSGGYNKLMLQNNEQIMYTRKCSVGRTNPRWNTAHILGQHLQCVQRTAQLHSQIQLTHQRLCFTHVNNLE